MAISDDGPLADARAASRYVQALSGVAATESDTTAVPKKPHKCQGGSTAPRSTSGLHRNT